MRHVLCHDEEGPPRRAEAQQLHQVWVLQLQWGGKMGYRGVDSGRACDGAGGQLILLSSGCDEAWQPCSQALLSCSPAS